MATNGGSGGEHGGDLKEMHGDDALYDFILVLNSEHKGYMFTGITHFGTIICLLLCFLVFDFVHLLCSDSCRVRYAIILYAPSLCDK